GEVPVVSATPPEIGETVIAPKISATSPETGETVIAPEISATLPENGETVIAPKVSTTSPETGETVIAPKISTASSETGETVIAPKVSTASLETGEVPVVSATPPEIGETVIAPKISATSPETGEIVIAPEISATLPETGETVIAPKISTASSETGETVIAPKVSTASLETGEVPVVSATPPEIGETVIAPKISATSPETGETVIAPEISATLPENGETVIAPKVSTTSPETGETVIAPKVSATSPENGETVIAPKVSTTSPEIGETVIAPKISTASPETGETASIFRKTIDNEQTVESEFPFTVTNPEISTFVDTSDNPTSPQDEVSTPPEVEQNSLQTPNFKESEEKTSPETSTKVDSFANTSLQLKSAETHSPQISNFLIPSSLGLDIGKQKLSILDSPQLNTLQNKTTDVGKPSPQYSSLSLIFRKKNLTNHTPSQSSNTPSQWSSVEELLNGNNDEFTSFNFNGVESNNQKSSGSPQVFAKHLPSEKGFTAGRKATPPDISRREIKPVTQTIKNTYSSSRNDKDDKASSSKADDKVETADLQALAREIYNRLRHRIEIERERHGHYSGRLPW
ncbi:hypothetical protein, partial [Nostoc sp.]|uniref:hypothetical protein n=1 Tax=Nostoc sp. TaxID=1180 RepID=UPI002FFCF52E